MNEFPIDRVKSACDKLIKDIETTRSYHIGEKICLYHTGKHWWTKQQIKPDYDKLVARYERETHIRMFCRGQQNDAVALHNYCFCMEKAGATYVTLTVEMFRLVMDWYDWETPQKPFTSTE